MATEKQVVITKIDMTGSEYTYTVPANTSEITFQAIAGTITMASTTSGGTYSIVANETIKFSGRDLPGLVLFFNGTNTFDLIVVRRTGLMS